jgi:5-methylcytosine-specific restriction endonuclease McrA
MAGKPKPTPEKFCLQCGSKLERKRYNGTLEDLSRFKRRRYCNATCCGLHHRHEDPTVDALRKRYLPLRGTSCQTCGATENVCLHHVDLNPANNDLTNLMTLCGSCHTRWHWEHGRTLPKSAPCRICGQPSKGYSLCQKHYQRFKKHGDPFLVGTKAGLRRLP